MEVKRCFTFDASHIVFGHKGLCSKLHGHTWEVTIGILGDPNPEDGVILTPTYVKQLVEPIRQRLHGTHLNYLLRMPTVENVTLYIAHELYSLAEEKLSLVRVEVPALMVYEWSVAAKDEDLFLPPESDEVVVNEGWHDAFDPIPAFASHKMRAAWVADHHVMLNKLYHKLHAVGAELAAFERYKASLDTEEAAKLLQELDSYELAKASVESAS